MFVMLDSVWDIEMWDRFYTGGVWTIGEKGERREGEGHSIYMHGDMGC